MGRGFWERQYSNLEDSVGDVGTFLTDPFTGASGKEAAKDATAHELAGLADSNALLKQGYDRTIEQNQTGLNAGAYALGQMQDLNGNDRFATPVESFKGNTTFGEQQPGEYVDPGFDFKADPGYQFRMKEAQDAVNAGAAARGNSFSGDTLSALAKRSGEVASEEVGNAFNRYNTNRNFGFNANQAKIGQFNTNRGAFQNSLDSNRAQFNTETGTRRQSNNDRFDRLNALAGFYTNATNNNTRAGSDYTGGIAGNAVAAGQARANGRIASQNARVQGQQNMGSAFKFLSDMGSKAAAGGG